MNNQDNYSASKHFDLKIWKRIFPFLAVNKTRFLWMIVLMIISALIDSYSPLFTSYAVNNFVVPATTAGMGRFVILFALLMIAQSAITVVYTRQCMIIEMGTGREMKKACFYHLQKLPIAYYNQNSVGYILARVMSDTNRICGTFAWGMIHFFFNVFYVIFIMINMFILKPSLALIMLCAIPVILLISVYFQPEMLKARREMRHANSLITGAFNEDISGAKAAKTLVIEDRLAGEFKSLTNEFYKKAMRSAKLSAVYNPLVGLIGSLALSAGLYYSGRMVLSDSLDWGTFSAFISYGVSMLNPISSIARMFVNFMDTQVNIERVANLLDEKITVFDSKEIEAVYGDSFDPKTESYPLLHGDIEFKNVSFRYPDAKEDEWVLRNLNLSIPAGKTVAIVGETGAGKSTLVNLVCRFFEPTDGQIFIDGVDYKERSLHWLHSNIGYVQQDPHLFSGTIRDNIKYGNPDADDDAVDRAAKIVSVDKLISKFENGYDTQVGEGGSMLSTGEKQLVSFARAVIANPAIFILDEATSSIDTETEQLIQNAIGHVLQGRTSFIIAHRLSTIRNSDIILLVDEHGIAERGSHDELMALNGQYAALYNAMRLKDASEEAGF